MTTTTTTEATMNDLCESLLRCSALCATILAELSASSKSSTPSPTVASIDDVRNDYIIITTSLGKESTSLSLAVKPPVSLMAAQGVVTNLHNHLIRLKICLSSSPQTGALVKEINWTAQEVVESVAGLLKSTHDALNAQDDKESKRKLVLSLTGLVWEKVELAKAISEDELRSTRKEWKSALGLLEDCLEEITELEQEDDTEEDYEDEEEDQEADDADFRSTTKLSDLEKQRVAAAHMLLRLGRLLLVRLINSSATASSSPSPYADPAFLVEASRLVQDVSAKADDVASSLDPPQLMPTISEYASAFFELVMTLSKEVERAIGEGSEEEKKWQGMAQEQFVKAKAKLETLI